MRDLSLRIKAMKILWRSSPAALLWITRHFGYLECLVDAKKYDHATNPKRLAGARFDIKPMVINFFKFSKTSRFAVFGAGKHTKWLETITAADIPVNVVAVLDDVPDMNILFWKKHAILASSFDPSTCDAIIISSDCRQEAMKKRCVELYGDKIPLIDLYEGLPPGPYQKS